MIDEAQANHFVTRAKWKISNRLANKYAKHEFTKTRLEEIEEIPKRAQEKTKSHPELKI